MDDATTHLTTRLPLTRRSERTRLEPQLLATAYERVLPMRRGRFRDEPAARGDANRALSPWLTREPLLAGAES